MPIKIYANKKCSVLVETIEWDSTVIIKLLNGGKKKLPNTTQAGEEVKAIVYIKNESKYPYGITGISFPDKRLSISIEKEWLESNEVTSLTVKFVVPKKITPQTVVKAGKIEIEGYHVYKESE